MVTGMNKIRLNHSPIEGNPNLRKQIKNCMRASSFIGTEFVLQVKHAADYLSV